MQVTTRGEAKTFAKILLDEKNDAFWSASQQNVLVDQANLIVFRELVKTNYEYFLNQTSFDYTSGEESVVLTAASSDISAVPYRIIDIGSTASSGSVSSSNPIKPFQPMRYTERHQINSMHSATTLDPGYHYAMVGDNLFLAPTPTSTVHIKMSYIEHLDSATADSDKLLGGKAHLSFGDCVGYCLAYLMNAKQNDANPAITKMWLEAQLRLSDNAVSRVSEDTGHVAVTRAPWE